MCPVIQKEPNDELCKARIALVIVTDGSISGYPGGGDAPKKTDFTEDLKKITLPVLVQHGDDDQIVPYADSAPLSAALLPNGILKTYPGFPHGMPTTHADSINNDILAFIKG